MYNFIRSICGVFIFITFAVSACQAGSSKGTNVKPLPPFMNGMWQVTKVYIDTGSSRRNITRDDKFNDYIFLGRTLSVSPRTIAINTPADKPCSMPEFDIKPTTVKALIDNSISTRLPGGTAPPVKDMKLPLLANDKVDVHYLMCEGKPASKNRGSVVEENLSNAVWFIVMSEQSLLMSWRKETILLLEPVTNDTKPVASYNCAKAGTVVEKTICGSVGLAAYDKSVSETYKKIRAYYRSKPNTDKYIKALKKNQREWLKKRDSCGSDEKCLEKSMSKRVSFMEYKFGDYLYETRNKF